MASGIARARTLDDDGGDDGVAQDVRHSPANRLTETQPWFMASFGTGHSCYG